MFHQADYNFGYLELSFIFATYATEKFSHEVTKEDAEFYQGDSL